MDKAHSKQFWMSVLGDASTMTFEQSVRLQMRIGEIVNHVNAWRVHNNVKRENVLFLHFRDLTERKRDTLRRLADHTRIAATDELLDKVIAQVCILCVLCLCLVCVCNSKQTQKQ